MTRWSSPLLSPSSERSDEVGVTISDEGSTSSIEVPVSGWYGFCFGTEKCVPRRDPIPSAVVEACFEAKLKSRDESSRSLGLPVRLSGEKEAIFSCRFGVLIYLPSNTRVSVVHRTLAEPCQPTSALSSVRWQLVLKREELCEQLKAGDPPESDKPFVCATCRRIFHSVKAVTCHVEFAHTIVDPGSVWNQPLQVLYQDDDLAVINKPQGMPVMGSRRSLMRSDLLMALVGSSTGGSSSSLSKPIPVHRLDSATGGLLVVAKTKEAERNLKTCFADRACRKQYHALVLGKLEMPCDGLSKTGSALLCDAPLSGKPATTHFRVIRHSKSPDPMTHDGWITSVALYPITGRRHQLRRHLREVGHAIWGDRRYARYPKRDGVVQDDTEEDRADALNSVGVETDPHARMCLWATEITFPHPRSGADVTVSLDEPEWLGALVKYQEEQWLLQNESND